MKPGDVNFEWNAHVLTAIGLCRIVEVHSHARLMQCGGWAKCVYSHHCPLSGNGTGAMATRTCLIHLAKQCHEPESEKEKQAAKSMHGSWHFLTPNPKSVTLFQTVFWWTTETKMLEIAISQQSFVFWTKCTSTIATNNPEGCLRRAYDATFNVFLHSYKIKQIFKVWILQKKTGFHHAIP